MRGKPGWCLDWLVFACLLGMIAAGPVAAFPDQPLVSVDSSSNASEVIPAVVGSNSAGGIPRLSPDDAPMTTQPTALIWQGPALGAGPGGEEDAVEYGQARLLPALGGAQGGPKVTFGGVFQVDAGWFNQSTSSQTAVGDVQDAAGVRRARINAFGSVAENVDFRLSMDFGFPGRPTFTDVFIDITSENRRATWFVSTYRSGNDQFGNDVSDSGGYAGMGRFSYLPFINDFDDHFLHVGGSFGISGANKQNIQYGALGGNAPEWGMFVGTQGTPDFTQSTPSFVNTGKIQAVDAILSNTELAYVLGPLSLQSEFTTSQVNRINNSASFFYAYYAQASLFLTGEHRPYNRNLGYFDRLMPNTTMGHGRPLGGAWEAALRLSHITLSDAGVQGGDLTDGTMAMNWYANPYTVFKFNFIHSFLDNKGNGKGGIYGPSNANVFAIRAQVDF